MLNPTRFCHQKMESNLPFEDHVGPLAEDYGPQEPGPDGCMDSHHQREVEGEGQAGIADVRHLHEELPALRQPGTRGGARGVTSAGCTRVHFVNSDVIGLIIFVNS